MIVWKFSGVLLHATLVTLWISWLALVLAAIMGSVVGYGRMARWWPVRAIATTPPLRTAVTSDDDHPSTPSPGSGRAPGGQSAEHGAHVRAVVRHAHVGHLGERGRPVCRSEGLPRLRA